MQTGLGVLGIKTMMNKDNTIPAIQVADRKRHTLVKYVILVFVFVLLLFSLIGIKPQAKHQEHARTTPRSSDDYRLDMQQNIQALKLRDGSNPALVKMGRVSSSHSLKTNRVMLARMNAPMSLGRAIKHKHTPSAVLHVYAERLSHINCLIIAGEIVPAVLETAVNSDLPGMVRAIVSRPIYAFEGSRVLIPKGSRLIGQYHSASNVEQSRVMIIWTRLVLPNGVMVMINSPGSDAMGRTGQQADGIDHHFWSQFGQASLLSLIGAGSATVGVGDKDQYNSLSQLRSGISQSFTQSASNALSKSAKPHPTLLVDAGSLINVFVVRDLDFSKVLDV